MRFERLELTAFGRFNGEVLDFSRQKHALHVVYGNNEAGKSTALRAIRGLLFGIPVQSQDTFVHAASDLRIGATLSAEGQNLSFVRRKGRKNTLLSASGQPLNDDALVAFLGGVDQNLFDAMFGLDHTRLREGALSLLALGGKVGVSLFGASMGATHLQSALATLRTSADDLFTARGRSRPLNVEIDNVRKAREMVNLRATPPHVYLEHRAELEAVEQQAASVSAIRRQIDAQRRELELVRRLLPLVAQWHAYREQMQTFGTLPALPQEAEQQVAALLRAHTDAQARHSHASREVQRLAAALTERTLDASVLAIPEETMRQLTERLGSARKAKLDLPKRRAELDAAHAEIRVLLTRMGLSTELDRLGELQMSKDEEAWLRRLIRERTQYDTRLAGSVEKQARADASMQTLKRALAKQADEVDVRALDGALIRAQKHVELEAQIERAKAQLEALDRSLATSAERLRPWLHQGLQASLTSAELWGNIPPVNREVLTQFSRRRLGIEEKWTAVREESVQLVARHAELLQAVALSEENERLPSNEGLVDVRRRRDEVLERAAELVSVDGDQARAAAFELVRERVRGADNYADDMRFHAAQLAELQLRRQRARELEALLLTRQKREEELAAELGVVDQQWTQVWLGSAFVVHSPERMSALLEVLAERDAALGARVEAHALVRRLEHGLAEVIAELSQELSRVGEKGRMLWETLPQFIARLEGVVQARKDSNQQRRDLAQRLAIEEERMAEAVRELAAEREGGKGLKAEWLRATKRLGLNKDAGTEAVGVSLDALVDVFHKVDEANALERRIAGIDRDARELNEAIAEVAFNVSPSLGITPDLAGLDKLLSAHQRESEAAVEHRRTVAELEQRKRALQHAELELEQCEQAVNHWFRLAQATDVEELNRVIVQVVHFRRLQRELADEERKIIAEGEGETLTALTARCEGRTSAAVQSELATLRERGQGLESEWEDLTRRRVQLEQTLEKLSVGAVAAAEELEAQVASLQSSVRKYLRLRLASTLLDREIERYRNENQGPVLSRVQQLFPRLTLDRYQGVSVEIGDADEPVLVCVNNEGRAVAIDALSDGTRDQLYLSLRVASLEQYFKAHEPMPVILDDAFIHFDDDRASAALRVLSELASSTQVLLFTHHRRMLELLPARDESGVEQVVIHELRDAASRVLA